MNKHTVRNVSGLSLFRRLPEIRFELRYERFFNVNSSEFKIKKLTGIVEICINKCYGAGVAFLKRVTHALTASAIMFLCIHFVFYTSTTSMLGDRVIKYQIHSWLYCQKQNMHGQYES